MKNLFSYFLKQLTWPLTSEYCSYILSVEHQNYFGVDENLGPVAVSVRRERLDDGKEKEGMQYNYRITFRTSQVKISM